MCVCACACVCVCVCIKVHNYVVLYGAGMLLVLVYGWASHFQAPTL